MVSRPTLWAVPSYVPPIALYFRVGRNDHKNLVHRIVEGGPQATGFVVEAHLAGLDDELAAEARDRDLEVILDPRAAELATQGGFSRSGTASIPWSGVALHTPTGRFGSGGPELADAIAEFAAAHGFTAVQAPTHILSGPDDPWFDIDRRLAERLRRQLDSRGLERVPIYYPLIVGAAWLRLASFRTLAKAALGSLEIDALWLRLHPFGTAKSGPIALRGYIDAAADLQSLGLPIIAERTGTIGLALAAFGAVGGFEGGITIGEGFDASRLLRPSPKGKAFLPTPRVYVEGAFLSSKEAKRFYAKRSNIAVFGCQFGCCIRGPVDTLRNPKRHFYSRRTDETNVLGGAPPAIRRGLYLADLRAKADLLFRTGRDEPALEPRRRQVDSWLSTLEPIALNEPENKQWSAVPTGTRLPRRRGSASK